MEDEDLFEGRLCAAELARLFSQGVRKHGMSEQEQRQIAQVWSETPVEDLIRVAGGPVAFGTTAVHFLTARDASSIQKSQFITAIAFSLQKKIFQKSKFSTGCSSSGGGGGRSCSSGGAAGCNSNGGNGQEEQDMLQILLSAGGSSFVKSLILAIAQSPDMEEHSVECAADCLKTLIESGHGLDVMATMVTTTTTEIECNLPDLLPKLILMDTEIPYSLFDLVVACFTHIPEFCPRYLSLQAMDHLIRNLAQAFSMIDRISSDCAAGCVADLIQICPFFLPRFLAITSVKGSRCQCLSSSSRGGGGSSNSCCSNNSGTNNHPVGGEENLPSSSSSSPPPSSSSSPSSSLMSSFPPFSKQEEETPHHHQKEKYKPLSSKSFVECIWESLSLCTQYDIRYVTRMVEAILRRTRGTEWIEELFLVKPPNFASIIVRSCCCSVSLDCRISGALMIGEMLRKMPQLLREEEGLRASLFESYEARCRKTHNVWTERGVDAVVRFFCTGFGDCYDTQRSSLDVIALGLMIGQCSTDPSFARVVAVSGGQKRMEANEEDVVVAVLPSKILAMLKMTRMKCEDLERKAKAVKGGGEGEGGGIEIAREDTIRYEHHFHEQQNPQETAIATEAAISTSTPCVKHHLSPHHHHRPAPPPLPAPPPPRKQLADGECTELRNLRLFRTFSGEKNWSACGLAMLLIAGLVKHDDDDDLSFTRTLLGYAQSPSALGYILIDAVKSVVLMRHSTSFESRRIQGEEDEEEEWVWDALSVLWTKLPSIRNLLLELPLSDGLGMTGDVLQEALSQSLQRERAETRKSAMHFFDLIKEETREENAKRRRKE